MKSEGTAARHVRQFFCVYEGCEAGGPATEAQYCELGKIQVHSTLRMPGGQPPKAQYSELGRL